MSYFTAISQNKQLVCKESIFWQCYDCIMAPPKKRPAESAVEEEEKTKRTRKPPFTDEEVTAILHRYEEKLVVFKNDANNSRVHLSQRREWEAIARMLNAKNVLVIRTWEEVRKKYQNMVSLAKVC